MGRIGLGWFEAGHVSVLKERNKKMLPNPKFVVFSFFPSGKLAPPPVSLPRMWCTFQKCTSVQLGDGEENKDHPHNYNVETIP